MNNNIEYLQFIGRCLTLDVHPERKKELDEIISSESINWEKIVAYTSGQLVLPAFYLLLKRHHLTNQLPKDLILYFEEITRLNTERNNAIIDQVKSLNQLLKAHDIHPVFLKGTAHLLMGLYQHAGERMVGDIDFLVPEDKMVQAADLLIQKEEYKPAIAYKKESFYTLKHYPRLQNDRYVAAVEIHKDVLRAGHKKKLTGLEIIISKQSVYYQDLLFYVPATKHLMAHNVMNAQINDSAFLYRELHLRQLYDFLLLAQKLNPELLIKNQPKQHKIIRAYVAVANWVFSKPKGLSLTETSATKRYIKSFVLFLKHPLLHRTFRIIGYLSKRLYRYISVPVYALFDSNERKLLYYRLRNKEWYIKHYQSYVNVLKNM